MRLPQHRPTPASPRLASFLSSRVASSLLAALLATGAWHPCLPPAPAAALPSTMSLGLSFSTNEPATSISGAPAANAVEAAAAAAREARAAAAAVAAAQAQASQQPRSLRHLTRTAPAPHAWQLASSRKHTLHS